MFPSYIDGGTQDDSHMWIILQYQYYFSDFEQFYEHSVFLENSARK